MNELTRCKQEWEKPIKSNSGTHNRPTMRKKSLILISRTMEGFMKEKAFELSLVGLVGSYKWIKSKIYPLLSKQYEQRPGDIKPGLWGERLIYPISWSKEYLKDVKILGMRNGMKGNSEHRPFWVRLRCHWTFLRRKMTWSYLCFKRKKNTQKWFMHVFLLYLPAWVIVLILLQGDFYIYLCIYYELICLRS